jgi:hypothetical protein
MSNYELAMKMRLPRTGGRVCKPPLPDPEARSEARFGYAGAERMCLHGKWLAGLTITFAPG